MENKHVVRNAVVQPHFDRQTAAYIHPTDTTSRARLTSDVQPSMYCVTGNPTQDVIQFQASVSTVHNVDVRQFTRNHFDFSNGKSCPQTPPVAGSYPSKAVAFGSAFRDPESNWSRQMHETALRDMHREVLSPAGTQAVERCKPPQPWPSNFPTRLQNPQNLQVVQHQRPDSCIRSPPSELGNVQMNSHHESQPYTHWLAARQQGGSFNRSLPGERDSAFSSPSAHLVSPTVFSSLDMEIRRLRGMITRVEMLREKYKYHEGSLHYPRALTDPFQRDRGGPISLPPNGMPIWCAEQRRQKATVTRIESSSVQTSGYPFQQEIAQLVSPKYKEERDIKNQARYSDMMLNEQSMIGYFSDNQNNGMPRIVDVRSLAQGAGSAGYTDKPHRSPSENVHQKVSSNARNGVRLSTDSRNETGSVESLDSGFECMSSLSDFPSQRGPAFGHLKVKQTEDVVVKDELLIRQEPFRSHGQSVFAPTNTYITSPGSLCLSRRIGPSSSSPPLRSTRGNGKRPLQNAVTETLIKRPNTGINFDVPSQTPELTQHRSSETGESSDRVLDLSLKKLKVHEISDRKDSNKLLQMQTDTNDMNAAVKLESLPINLTTRTQPSIACIGTSQPVSMSCRSSSESCSLGTFQHGNAASMEDLVALSVKLANEVPQGKESGGFREAKTQDQRLETRGRLMTKFNRRTGDMLKEPPRSPPSTQGSPTTSNDRFTGVYRESRTPKPQSPKSKDQEEDIPIIHSYNNTKEHCTQMLDAVQTDLKSVVSHMNPRCIDFVVSEALCGFRSPPEEEEIMEKQDMAFDSFSPNETMGRPIIHTPVVLTSSQEETEKDTYNIPAAVSLHTEINMKSERQSGQQAENLQPTQKSPSAPQTSQSEPTIKFPDVRVLVRPLKPITPKSVVQVTLPVGVSADLWSNSVNIIEAPGTMQERQIMSDGIQDSTTDPSHHTPNFLVPTEDGFKRMQKVDAKCREIYRVMVHRLETAQSQHSVKQSPRLSYSVDYMKMTFPCVLRSEIPFVPTQLLVQDLFPRREPSEVCQALKQCNILDRYMNLHELKTLQKQLKRRGISSCKLIPLDEFHNNWKELVHIMHYTATTEDQK